MSIPDWANSTGPERPKACSAWSACGAAPGRAGVPRYSGPTRSRSAANVTGFTACPNASPQPVRPTESTTFTSRHSMRSTDAAAAFSVVSPRWRGAGCPLS